jgi:RNA polymerase sigma factor (sigma-70 family)
LRSRGREAKALGRAGVTPEAVDDLAERRATRAAVAQAVDRLPDRLRVPVILAYYLDLSERDIARTLGIRPGTVKSRLHEARTKLADDADIVAATG